MENEKIITILTSRIEKIENCWIWHGLLGKHDAPIFHIKTDTGIKNLSARKYAPLLVGLPLPNNRVFVLCGNNLCLNPAHLVYGDEARFWAKVQKLSEANGGCWIWCGAEDKNGYGKFCYYEQGKQVDVRAHRYSWEIRWGAISSSVMMVCHKCDNPRCVNPNHLFLGTGEDNAQDRDQKGRANTPVGSRSSFSKLTEKDVIDIRVSDMKAKQLAPIYHVGIDTIYNIRNRKIWTHI